MEQTINVEGVDSLFLFDRLHNPTIRKQVLDLLREAQEAENKEYYQNPYFTPHDTSKIEETFNEKFALIERDTPISFGANEPTGDSLEGREIIGLDWIFPTTGKKPTTRMMGIIEGHEKGHVMRNYYGKHLNEKFKQAFDLTAVTFTEKEYREIHFKENGVLEPHGIAFEQSAEEFFRYLFCAPEIAERMSQLKSYFSMKDDAPFTKEQIDYARQHYIDDTGVDNWMVHFFKAITPEKEEAFLRLINSAGI